MKNKISFALLLGISLTAAPHPIRGEESPILPEQSISLNFQNTDLDLVLKFFSDVSGTTFIKSDSVRGFVTVMAPGKVTVSEAMNILEKVLELKGFTMVPGSGKMTRVLTQAEAVQGELEVNIGSQDGSIPSGDRMMTQVIPLKFVAVQDMKNELTPLVSKGGLLIADERMNSLVVTDMASNIRRLMKMIASLDVRTPQVLIESLIMEVSLTKETKLGIEWNKVSGFNSANYHFVGSLSQKFNVPSLVTQGLKYSIIRDDADLTALFQALATDQNVNILSTPHILTLNNQPALIRVGEEVPILSQTRNVQGGETIRSFDFKTVAIELEVTPRVNSERDVYLKVHPSVKKILGFNAELNAPILASREAQTSVIIKDGQTVVIGGLMKDDRSKSQSKIPILGDVPFLGNLFKSQDMTREKTELLVFITPHVVLNSDEARDLTIRKETEMKSAPTPYRIDAQSHYALGKFFYKKKCYDEAIRELQKVSDESPDEKLKQKASRLMEKAKKKKG